MYTLRATACSARVTYTWRARMFRILLTHSPEALANCYGARALDSGRLGGCAMDAGRAPKGAVNVAHWTRKSLLGGAR